MKSLFETTGSMENIKKPGIRAIMFSNCAGPYSKVHKICAPVSKQSEFENLIEQCKNFVNVSLGYVAAVIKVGDKEIYAYGKNGKEYRSSSMVNLPDMVCVKIFNKDVLALSTTAKMYSNTRRVENAIYESMNGGIYHENDNIDYSMIADALKKSIENIKRNKEKPK